MAGNGVTLKEIGNACGVTPSTVSAILRGNHANVRCSTITRAKVLDAAKRLNYQPNRLAQSLVSGAPPIAALVLHAQRMMPFSFYSYDNLRQAALSLHEHDYEMTFVPFENAEEQLGRLRRLVEGRLIGGIITNFIVSDYKRVASYLKNSRIPTIVLGQIPDAGLPYLYIDHTSVLDQLVKKGQAQGFKRVIIVDVVQNTDNTATFNFCTDYGDLAPGDVDFAVPDTLFLARGGQCGQYLREARQVPAQRIWTLEDKRLNCPLRPLIHVTSPQSRRMALAVQLLVDWMSGRRVPAAAPIPVSPDEGDIEWLEA